MQFNKIHLLMLCITAFFAMAGGAILAPALPDMVEPLQTTSHEVALLISGYTISTAIFTLVIGNFIDRMNRKKLLIPCLVIYGIMGLVSFFTYNLQLLILLRLIQGIGAAGMLSLTMLVIRDVYVGQERLHATSKVSTALAIGSISGPLIGGGLASVGWNYPFLFYALSLPFAVAVIFLFPETRVMKENEGHDGILSAFTALKDLRVMYTVFLSFTIYFLLFSVVVYLPFMIEGVFGYTAKEAGLILALEGIAVVLTIYFAKNLVRKHSSMPIIAIGFVLIGLAIIYISFASSVFVIILLMLLFGAGYGLAQPLIDTQIIHVAPAESTGGVLSIHNAMRNVGQSLAPILLGIILSHFDLGTVFIVSGSFGLLVALITYFMKNFFESSGNDYKKETKVSLSH